MLRRTAQALPRSCGPRMPKVMRALCSFLTPSGAPGLLAILVRMVLAYVLVVPGVAASALYPASVGTSPVLCLNGTGSSEDAPPARHDMTCCIIGCMAGGGLFLPPDRADLARTLRSAVLLHHRPVAVHALPRAPTSAFHARGPPVAD